MSRVIKKLSIIVIFPTKSTDIFLISPQKHMLWYPLEACHRVASNEYPQHRKIITAFSLKAPPQVF